MNFVNLSKYDIGYFPSLFQFISRKIKNKIYVKFNKVEKIQGQVREENKKRGRDNFFCKALPPKENLKWRPCYRFFDIEFSNICPSL